MSPPACQRFGLPHNRAIDSVRYLRPRNIIDYLGYLVVRIFVCVVQAMPIETCAVVARWLATICSSVLKIRRRVVEDNLKHAFPEMSAPQRKRLAWRMWEHLFLMVIEVIHAPRKIHHTNWRDYVTLVNAEEIIRAFFDDRPTVLICGHYGNFELSGYVLGVLGFPSFTIARALDNPYLDRFLNEFRAITGQYILSKSGSSGEVEEVLARGGILAMLADQHAGRKGCWVEFFGRPASSHKGIALFTLASEAPTIFCFARRTGRPLELEMGTDEILEPREMPAEMRTVTGITKWYTRHLERTIRQAPEQYWWLHRRWREYQPRRKRTARTEAPTKAA
jgi:Kdo2-lipid IVA lauroyltransferase/acyltransferase